MFNFLMARGTDPKVDALRRISIFSGLSNRELEFVASRMDEASALEGQVLTREGVSGHTFYVLLEGSVEMSIDGQVVATRGAGDVFGEISMLDRGPATATVRAIAPLRLLVMSHEQFRDAVRSLEAVKSDMMAVMEERLRANAEAGFDRPGRTRA